MNNPLKLIYERAALCRAFEDEVARRIEDGTIKCPVYLSTGQEYIPATISVWLEELGIKDYKVFVQHRAHSHYLCFGGDMDKLILELLGDSRGCSSGMGGSNCPQSEIIFGHDSLLGSQVPIAVGYAFATNKPVICFMGDAAAEEDYVLASLGWAATKMLPILFVVEDNGLSIKTEKKVRRSWEAFRVARAFGLVAKECTDDPEELLSSLPPPQHCWPALINVQTTRLQWHSGAGVNDANAFDRHHWMASKFNPQYVKTVKYVNEVREIWNVQEL